MILTSMSHILRNSPLSIEQYFVCSAMDEVSATSSSNDAPGERVHKVYCLSGYKQDDTLNTKVSGLS